MLAIEIINLLKESYKDITLYVVTLYLIDNKKYDEVLLFRNELQSLVNNNFVVRSTEGDLIINDQLIDSEKYVNDKINEYRKIWHYTNSGVKGKMGNIKNCKERVKEFIKTHDISIDNLIELATYYVTNFQQISGYLQQADYFLYKEKIIGGKKITESRAANLLEEYGDFTVDDTLTI